jgi:hypothetical protein
LPPSNIAQRPDSVAHLWQWRIELEGAVVRRSGAFFYTLDDCIRDAQEHGFKAQLSASDSFGQTSYRMDSPDDDGNPTPRN